MTAPLPDGAAASESKRRRADSQRGLRTRRPPSFCPPEQRASLSLARKRAHGPYRCDWCGELKADIRRNGPRICRDCWVAHVRRSDDR